MRILLTNHALDERAGSELYVRDVALALLARDHEPIVYSRRLGQVASDLRRATVTVIDDLNALAQPPDLIHAQHHLETMTALARFPGTPAIYLCHGWLPSEEAPPAHPRILRYVAVDELVRKRLVDECGIGPERVETYLNFVDLDRFAERNALPAVPSKALVFSNQISEARGLPELRDACAELGLTLDAVGRDVGNPCLAPEEILGDYDVVFAKARAAMEALAVGCAVVLCDAAGLGPMVNSGELARLRALNFGVRLLREPITAEGLVQRLGQYDASDATAVRRTMRREASLAGAVDQLLSLYQKVLSEHEPSMPDPQAEARAVAGYLRHGPLTADFFQFERFRYEKELTRTGEWARALSGRVADLRRTASAREDEIRRLQGVRGDAERLSADLDAERRDHEAARNEAERLGARLAEAERELASVQGELDWMRSSLTWQWRRRMLSLGWLRRIYQVFRSHRG